MMFRPAMPVKRVVGSAGLRTPVKALCHCETLRLKDDRGWRNLRLQPKTAFSRFPPVHRTYSKRQLPATVAHRRREYVEDGRFNRDEACHPDVARVR